MSGAATGNEYPLGIDAEDKRGLLVFDTVGVVDDATEWVRTVGRDVRRTVVVVVLVLLVVLKLLVITALLPP